MKRVGATAPAHAVRVLASVMLMLAICLGGTACNTSAESIADAAQEKPPNIIVILSDDVGAETIGVYGGESYQTPKLDALARDGVYFEYAHAQPLCTPSRVKLMTGRHNYANYTNFGYLDPKERTFAHLLKAQGYNTMIAGKWQLYSNPFENLQGATPQSAGFDEYHLWQLLPKNKGSRYWGPLIDHNGDLKQYPTSHFGPDVFNQKVLDYIKAQRDTPFFIYYPMVLAHDPFVTTPDMRDESRSDQDKYAAMIAYMDKMVGNVRTTVTELGLADNTVIFFIGDNGTPKQILSTYRGREVRGAKAETINAGSGVPFIVWGPGVVSSAGSESAARMSDSLINLNDVLPTLAELSGARLPEDAPTDGLSLSPVLRGHGELGRSSLFIHYEPRWPSGLPARYALDRRWKLYEGGGFFDTRQDPLEKQPLAVDQLQGEALAAYQLLAQRIAQEPGELRSTERWFPDNFADKLKELRKTKVSR